MYCTVMYIQLYILVMCSGKRVQLFLSGDYEFLCRMFGLSGAAGYNNSNMASS